MQQIQFTTVRDLRGTWLIYITERSAQPWFKRMRLSIINTLHKTNTNYNLLKVLRIFCFWYFCPKWLFPKLFELKVDFLSSRILLNHDCTIIWTKILKAPIIITFWDLRNKVTGVLFPNYLGSSRWNFLFK